MNRNIWLALILIAGAASQAHGETWRADTVLNLDRSAGSCPRSGGSEPYELELVGDTFSARVSAQKYFTIKVPADGKIKENYKSASSAQLQMVGNVRTKDLEVVNERFGCRWKMVVRQ